MNGYEQMLDQLKAGEIESITLEKGEFMEFREVLLARPDFKHFKGTAYHGGKTVYVYTEEAEK